MTFESSAVGNVTMIIFGEALQRFAVNFVQGKVLCMIYRSRLIHGKYSSTMISYVPVKMHIHDLS